MRKEQKIALQKGWAFNMLGNISFSGAETAYNEAADLYRQVEGSDFYVYTLTDTDLPDEQIPHINSQLIHYFYASIIPYAKDFDRAQNRILDYGRELVSKDTLSPNDFADASRSMLENGYQLVENTVKVIKAPLTPFKQMNQLKPMNQIQLKTLASKIGKQKEEPFKETVRRYIPRWMTHTISCPVDPQSGEQASEIANEWSHYREDDVEFLVNPLDIEQGAPLHRVFTIADRQEDADMGYFIKTSGILQTLEMEEEQVIKTEKAELPLFHYVMAGSMLGRSYKKPKDAYFDFHGAISTTMKQTFERLQTELQTGNRGMASKFLDQLYSHYPKEFSSLFAESLLNHGETGHYDELVLMRELMGSSLNWSSEVMDHLLTQPKRRVIGYGEVEQLSSVLGSEFAEVNDFDQFIDDATTIIGDEDTYSFKLSFNKAGYPTIGGDIHVELDSMDESMVVELVFNDGKTTRTVPLTLSLSGDTESVHIETIEGLMDNLDVTIAYRNAVAKAIHVQATTIRRQIEAQQRMKRATPLVVKPESEIVVRKMSREERMAMYMQKRALVQQQSSRQLSTQPKQPLEQKYAVYQEPEKPQIEVIGLDTDTVSQFMQQEKIEGIDPERLIQKVDHYVHVALVSKKMLGKRVDVRSVGEAAAEKINLRQLTWILDGGTTGIRIYLQDVGEGNFVLRGVMSKKGEAQQTRYIEKIIYNILQELEK